MQSQQVMRYRKRLEGERHRILKDLRGADRSRRQSMRTPGDLSNDPQHRADRDATGVTKQARLENALGGELERVDAAIQRTEQGTFGQCRRCGKEISTERLDALPHAARCIECERIHQQDATSR